MAKKKFAPWPYRIRGLYVVLGISLLLNAIALSFIVHINSRTSDMAVMSFALNNTCVRDYDWIMAHGNVGEGENAKAFFSEGLCHRDVVTGEAMSADRIHFDNGHMVQN